MQMIQKLHFCKFLALIFACTLGPAGLASSATCYVQLTKAEVRWDAMRNSKALATDVKRDVTEQLTQAAELRHQGREQDCLLQTKKAMKEMDLLETRP